MSRIITVLLLLLALAAIGFLAIYEPLTRSRREADWLDRSGRVLDLNPADVRKIRIVSGADRIELRRRGNAWQLGPKSKDRADRAKVEKILSVAAGLEFYDRIDASHFRDRDALGEYGLRNPKRHIEFTSADRTTTLYLGKDGASENRLYARTNRTNDVFLIGDALLGEVFVPAAEYRDRRLTDLAPDDVDRIIIRRDDAEMELQHDAVGWQIVKPLQAPADPAKVRQFLQRLLGLRIVEFVGDDTGDLSLYGITEGHDEITFLAKGSEKRQTLRLGADRDEAVFGQFTARDSVYRLPLPTRELLAATPDSLRDRRLLPLNLDMVDLIRVTTPDEKFTLRRRGNGWEVKPEGAEASPVNPDRIAQWIAALGSTTVASYSPAFGAALESFGLAQPLVTLEFVAELSENTPEARAGEFSIARIAFGRTEDGTLHARTDENPEVLSIPPGFLDALPVRSEDWR